MGALIAEGPAFAFTWAPSDALIWLPQSRWSKRCLCLACVA